MTDPAAPLDDALDAFERTEWSAVEGISVAEAAALSERLAQARDRTRRELVATDGGRP